MIAKVFIILGLIAALGFGVFLVVPKYKIIGEQNGWSAWRLNVYNGKIRHCWRYNTAGNDLLKADVTCRDIE
jgi:hypothetical protein